MTGLHQGLTPIHAELLNQYGVTILLPILAMAGAGQVGASIAVYLKTKNQKLKQTIASALPVGFMGIGEPLILRCNLTTWQTIYLRLYRRCFRWCSASIFPCRCYLHWLICLLLTASTDKMLYYLIGLFTAYIFGFIATLIIGFNDPIEE